MKLNRAFKIVIPLLISTVLVFSFILSNPLYSSTKTIKKRLLKKVPIGTQMDEVIAFINSQKSWKIAYISEKSGFYKQEIGGSKTVVGVKSIRTEIGEYRDPQFGFIFITSVTLFWGFDENSKLIDIDVWKTTDAL